MDKPIEFDYIYDDTNEYEIDTINKYDINNIDLKPFSYSEKNTNQLKKRSKKNCFENVNFDNKDLSKIKIEDCALVSSSFYKTDLFCSEFIKTDLRFSNFNLANLMHTTFKNCFLQKTKFCNANLNGSIIYNCNFTKVDFRGADLTNCIFHQTQLKGAIFDDHTRLPFSLLEAKDKGMVLQSKHLAVAS